MDYSAPKWIKPLMFHPKMICSGFAALALSACATSKPPPPSTTVVSVQCLPLASYSPEEQRKAASELAALPPGSSLAKLVIDYGKLRAADRACLETPPH